MLIFVVTALQCTLEGGERICQKEIYCKPWKFTSSDGRFEMDVILNGEGSRTRVISRSVAKEASTQVFYPRVQGNAPCFGHVSCDAIIMGTAKVRAIPEISCNHVDAGLIHEAAIGRIAGEQLLKLETLGLTPEEAEEKILEGFLR